MNDNIDKKPFSPKFCYFFSAGYVHSHTLTPNRLVGALTGNAFHFDQRETRSAVQTIPMKSFRSKVLIATKHLPLWVCVCSCARARVSLCIAFLKLGNNLFYSIFPYSFCPLCCYCYCAEIPAARTQNLLTEQAVSHNIPQRVLVTLCPKLQYCL